MPVVASWPQHNVECYMRHLIFKSISHRTRLCVSLNNGLSCCISYRLLAVLWIEIRGLMQLANHGVLQCSHNVIFLWSLNGFSQTRINVMTMSMLPGQYHRSPYLQFSMCHFKRKRKRSMIEQRKTDMEGRVEGKVDWRRWGGSEGELEWLVVMCTFWVLVYYMAACIINCR